VHILQGDLILHKRTLEPIKTLIYGLRRYDVDRVAALEENNDPSVKVQGYMSHKAKIYLVRGQSLIYLILYLLHVLRLMSMTTWNIFFRAWTCLLASATI
jgi:hypothetical protein